MLKKVLLIFCLIIGALLLFPVLVHDKCDGKTHISFASWGSESEIKILKPILKDFENINPDIKVDFMHIPQNYFQKLHLLYASNTAPDVIFINNLYLPVYANAGVLSDLSEYDLEYDKFYKTSLGWTYNDFVKTAQKLTKRGESFGMSFDEGPLYFLSYLVMYGEWTSEDTLNYFKKDILSKPKINEALNTYADLRYKYHCAPLKQDLGSMTNGQMFLLGKLGMYFSGRWMVPKLREDAKFDWDVIEFPTLTGKEKSSVLTDSSGWALSKSSKHKPEAVKLIKYLSSKRVSEEFTKSGLIVPARLDVAYSKVFNDGKKPLNSKAFLNTAQNSRPTPVTVNYNEILDDLKQKTEYIFNK